MQNEKVICNKFSFAYDSNTFGIHDIDLTIQEGEFIDPLYKRIDT